jgi:hypothetical protein
VLLVVSQCRLLSDAQWVLIEDLLPVRAGEQGRPFSVARSMAEGIVYRYRCGIAMCLRSSVGADDLNLAPPDGRERNLGHPCCSAC